MSQFELLPGGLAESCIEQLQLLLTLLQTLPSDFTSITSTFGVVEERLGSLRLSAAELVADLVETQQMSIVEAVCNSQLLDALLNHFFNFTWNNALHCCVLRVCAAALPCEDQMEGAANQPSERLQKRLFSSTETGGCGLLERLVDEYEAKCGPCDSAAGSSAAGTNGIGQNSPNDNADTLSDLSEEADCSTNAIEANLVQASQTCGYMGALIEIALMVHDSPRVVERMGDPDLEAKWGQFDSSVLASLRPVRDECLGGVPPTSKPQGCGQM
jgi:hypothetical protein